MFTIDPTSSLSPHAGARIFSDFPPSIIKGKNKNPTNRNPLQIIPQKSRSFSCRHQTRAQPLSSETMSEQNPVLVVSQQRVIVSNKHGEKLAGVLHSTGSKEIVVLCHGFRSTKDERTMLTLADAITSQRISAFRFDFSGNGESEGDFAYGNYHKEAEDLHSVIQYLSLTNTVSAIIGHSKGGDVVILYASIYRDVPIVINISGRFDLTTGMESRIGKGFMERVKKDGFIDVKNRNGNVEYQVTEASLMDRLNTDIPAACRSIDKDCRVLTIYGSADEVTPVKDAIEFEKLIPNHKLHIIEGANHIYAAHQDELASVVMDFLILDKAGDSVPSGDA